MSPLLVRLRDSQVTRSLGVLAGLGLIYLAFASVLRLVWILRPDPYGNRFIHAPQEYVLQAIAFDAMQAGWLALPFVVLIVAIGLRGRPLPAWTDASCRAGFATLLVLATLIAIFDQEFMRFMGVHLSLSMIDTYFNSTALSILPNLMRHDRGGPYLGFVLLSVAVVGSSLAMRRFCRRPPERTALHLAGFAAILLISHAGIRIAYGSTTSSWIHHWRLATPLDLARLEWRIRTRPALSGQALAEVAAAHQARWRRANDTRSSFPWPEFPLFHVTPHQHCNLIGTAPIDPMPVCQVDADGDGVALQRDCDDADAATHPGADDLPGNARDEDCSGADAAPPNVLLLVLESHRALSVGHLAPAPVTPPVTPRLDRLASEGAAFSRASSNGLPTIASFMAIHTSLLPHPDLVVGATFTMNRMRSLPERLREHGYHARFFSGPDPAWDNQRVWAQRWYDGVDHDPDGQADADMLARLGRWLRQHGASSDATRQPFFVMAMTVTNHYPFDIVDGVERPARDSLRDRMHATMRYADRAMGDLIEAIRHEPWYGNTIVVVTGDHGYPLGEHGSYRITETAHAEATSVPLVFAGGHPLVARLRERSRDQPVSHLDLAPTILALAGIDPSGSWMGRSLLEERAGQTLTIAPLGWVNERGHLRVLVDPRRWPRADAIQSFDRSADPLEQHPLDQTDPRAVESTHLANEVVAAAELMRWSYQKNRLWPEWPSARSADARP